MWSDFGMFQIIPLYFHTNMNEYSVQNNIYRVGSYKAPAKVEKGYRETAYMVRVGEYLVQLWIYWVKNGKEKDLRL